MRFTRKLTPAAIALAAGLSAAPGAMGDELGIFNDWSAFRDGAADRPVCYMGSVPQKEEGDYSQRGDTYVLVTHRPAENSIDVVSVTAGYDYQQGSEVEVEIDGQDYPLFTDGDNAWARDEQSDKALVDAMRRGNSMVVRGTSSRGTLTTDTYSLSGFTAAHDAISEACPQG